MIHRNDSCWCGSGIKWKKCCYPKQPFSHPQAMDYARKYGIHLKTPDEIAGIRKAARVTALILDALCQAAVAGVTTNALNELANQLHRDAQAIPAPLHYGDPPFPKSICTSLNEVICHGIPNDIPLKPGDIMNIDVSSIVDGYFGDCSRMVSIPPIDEEKHNVVQTAYEALYAAIAIIKPNLPIYAIGEVIEEVAAQHHCSVVYQFVGHGIGKAFHEPPQIYHHRNTCPIPLIEGMVFTIEPMINAGAPEGVIDPYNQWEARTVDGKPSAQWEHQLLVTAEGCEILTLPP